MTYTFKTLKKVVDYMLRSRMSFQCKHLLYLTFVWIDTGENKFYFNIYRNVFQVASSRQEFSKKTRINFLQHLLKWKFAQNAKVVKIICYNAEDTPFKNYLRHSYKLTKNRCSNVLPIAYNEKGKRMEYYSNIILTLKIQFPLQ